MILSLVIFTDIVPLRYRPKYYGIVQGSPAYHEISIKIYTNLPTAAWALGTIIGPILGGAIAQNITWRWIFYIMFPLCAIGFATLSFLSLLPAVFRVPRTALSSPRRLHPNCRRLQSARSPLTAPQNSQCPPRASAPPLGNEFFRVHS